CPVESKAWKSRHRPLFDQCVSAENLLYGTAKSHIAVAADVHGFFDCLSIRKCYSGQCDADFCFCGLAAVVIECEHAAIVERMFHAFQRLSYFGDGLIVGECVKQTDEVIKALAFDEVAHIRKCVRDGR